MKWRLPVPDILPVGERETDPDPRQQGWRFRVALAIHKYPIHAALLVALFVATVGVSISVGAIIHNRNKTVELERTAVTKGALARFEASRDRVSCYRSQMTRAYLAARAGQLPDTEAAKQAGAIFRIVDCDRTYAVGYGGPTIYLKPGANHCFVHLVSVGYFNHREPFTSTPQLLQICRTT